MMATAQNDSTNRNPVPRNASVTTLGAWSMGAAMTASVVSATPCTTLIKTNSTSSTTWSRLRRVNMGGILVHGSPAPSAKCACPRALRATLVGPRIAPRRLRSAPAMRTAPMTIAPFRAIAALALALAARPVAAQPASEPAQYLGHVRKDIAAAASTWDPGPPATDFSGNVYANVATSLHVGLSSTALGSTWGDRVMTTGTGTLVETDFTVFNSPSS